MRLTCASFNARRPYNCDHFSLSPIAVIVVTHEILGKALCVLCPLVSVSNAFTVAAEFEGTTF